MESLKHYINGDWLEPESEEFTNVINPSTEETISKVPEATDSEIDRAFEAADSAFEDWKRAPAPERVSYLFDVIEVLRDRRAEIGKLITLENGKPLSDGKGEIEWTTDVLEFFAEEGKRISGEVVPRNQAGARSFVIKQPLGTIVAIGPWNFPVDLLIWKIAPALAAGNAVVIKPSQETPMAITKVVKAFDEVGLPAGVLNMVHGSGGETGDKLVKDKRVDKIAFTGSTAVGKHIIRQSASTLPETSMELGGHAPFVVTQNGDLDKAIPEGIRRCFSHAGQICHSVNQIVLEEPIAEEFIERFVAGTEDLVIGDGVENPDADLGPLTTKAGLQDIEEHVSDALEKGAQLLTGGKKPAGSEFERGYFYEPTVLKGITDDMDIATEETFGPVAPITVVDDTEEAVRAANNTRYGLAAYIYSDNTNEAVRIAEKLEAGSVGINNNSVCRVEAPWGGWKDSGFGRELSSHGLDEYLQLKHIKFEFTVE